MLKILQEINKAKESKKPFVAYKNPNESLVTLFIQNTNDLFVFDDFNQRGYVFAPFDDCEDAYIIKPDIVVTDEIKFGQYDELENTENNYDGLAKSHYINLVQNTVDAIQNSFLSKVVLSRKEKIETFNFNVTDTFERLLNQYKNAYVYVWYHPKVGLWLGATPETLVTLKEKEFKTMALAGTQPYRGNLNPVWGVKELQEQQMVVDFIKKKLVNNVSDLSFSATETIKAGNVLHLKTNITGTLKNIKDVKMLLKLLHPTPAVCGLPKQESKQYILENEGYHRSFYTGYLGVLNHLNQTSLYVNLRCFQWIDDVAYVYVGGGVTAKSNPEAEWMETVEKSKTIKSVLV